MWGDPVGFGVKKQYSKLKWGSNLEPSASEEVALSILSADNRLSLQLEKLTRHLWEWKAKIPLEMNSLRLVGTANTPPSETTKG